MTNYTAFNYNKNLKDRDLSKIYETQKFELSTTDQDFISLSELVENGVSGVLRSNTGRKKIMSYDEVVEPVGGYDLSDVDPSFFDNVEKYLKDNKEKEENVKIVENGVSSSSSVAESQPSKEEVSELAK